MTACGTLPGRTRSRQTGSAGHYLLIVCSLLRATMQQPLTAFSTPAGGNRAIRRALLQSERHGRRVGSGGWGATESMHGGCMGAANQKRMMRGYGSIIAFPAAISYMTRPYQGCRGDGEYQERLSGWWGKGCPPLPSRCRGAPAPPPPHPEATPHPHPHSQVHPKCLARADTACPLPTGFTFHARGLHAHRSCTPCLPTPCPQIALCPLASPFTLVRTCMA